MLILVDGGLRTGIVALRRELAPVLTLGIVGTFATFALVAVATHWVAGLDWSLALIVGAALSPTDPAAVFSVLHDRGGDGSSRIATVLEGEAGFNDPVAIALVIALLDATQHGHDAHVLDVAWTMLRDGVVAAVVGVGLALILDRLRVAASHRASGSLPRSWSRWEHFSRSASPQSHTVPASSRPTSSGSCSAIACTRGGRRWPRSTTSLSSLAEVGMFVLLGVALTTVPLRGSLADAVLIATLLVPVIPAAHRGSGAACVRRHPQRGDLRRMGGLKGAVPILLGSLPLARGLAEGNHLFALVGLLRCPRSSCKDSPLGWLARRLGI